jgi:hypothetical protein
MKWYRKLYLGENAKKSKYKIFRRVRMNKFSIDTYLITLPSNDENLLDVFQANMLLQPYYKKADRDIFVVGIANGKDEAYEVVRDIIDDVYSHTGAFDIKKYLGISYE